jgi:hypothetical protein
MGTRPLTAPDEIGKMMGVSLSNYQLEQLTVATF